MKTKGEIVIYQNNESKSQVEVKLLDETLWLSLNQISMLFQRNKSSISRHINNIYKTGELDLTSTVANFATVQIEGDREVERTIEYYNMYIMR